MCTKSQLEYLALYNEKCQHDQKVLIDKGQISKAKIFKNRDDPIDFDMFAKQAAVLPSRDDDDKSDDEDFIDVDDDAIPVDASELRVDEDQ